VLLSGSELEVDMSSQLQDPRKPDLDSKPERDLNDTAREELTDRELRAISGGVLVGKGPGHYPAKPPKGITPF
jgi:hypothetical protein